MEERKHLRYKIRADRPEEEIEGNERADKSSDRENWNAQKGGSTLRWNRRTFKVIEEKFKTVREEKREEGGTKP